MPEKDSKYWIERLRLEAHAEGGYFRQTYRSDVVIAREALPMRFGGDRPASTGIFFLLEGKEFSAFHRLHSDEMWHFYEGSGLVVHVIDLEGVYSKIYLGGDVEKGQVFQAVVTAGYWFAAEVVDRKSYALVGCTVAPGFDFEDFELAKRLELVSSYPEHRELIERLTRD